MTDGREEEKNVEIIAEKPRTAAYVFLALAALGVAVAAAGVILYLTIGRKTVDLGIQVTVICLTALGALLIVVFTALYIRQLYRTFALITFENGALKFGDGTACRPDEITAVEKGKNEIRVTVNGEKKVISGVARCDKAYRKLCVLTGNPVS